MSANWLITIEAGASPRQSWATQTQGVDALEQFNHLLDHSCIKGFSVSLSMGAIVQVTPDQGLLANAQNPNQPQFPKAISTNTSL